MKDLTLAPLAPPLTILVTKNKGGVGASHLAMALATVLRIAADGKFSTSLIDLDGSTGTSISRLGERDEHGLLLEEQSFEAGVPAFNMLEREQRGKLFDILETDDRFVVLDGPATSLDVFAELTENLTAAEWVSYNRERARSLVVMIPITPSLASIVDVPKAIDRFGPDADYVVVRSMRGCKPADYTLWDSPDFPDKFGRIVSGRSKQRLAEVGGTVLDMPALDAGVLARAEALKVTFAEALHSPLLRADARISVRQWLKSWTAQLDRIREPLGLEADFDWKLS